MPAPLLAQLAVTHLNLDVADLDVSERFYRDELGLTVTRRPSSLAARMPDFLLVLAQGAPKVGGTFHFGFRVANRADVDAWFTHLRARNVTIVTAPGEQGAVYVGRLSDPDGYNIEIYCDLP